MGILGNAGVSPNEVPKDPFGFGNDYWPVKLVNVKPRKDSDQEYVDISSSGKQFGGMFVFQVLDERFAFLGANNPTQVPGQLGFGQWWALPSPEWARAAVPFDLNSQEGKQLVHNWGKLTKAMGIPADVDADIADLIGKTCLAKIFPKEDENGYWQFRVAGFKQLPKDGSPEGFTEFTKEGTSNPESGMSAMEKALREETGE
jgi:hypothetical protein